MEASTVVANPVAIPTSDGVIDATVFHPAGNGPWPGVLFFMDGLGLRPALSAMARRLAAQGYEVLLPNLYYRAGAFAPINPATVWDDEAERARIMGFIGATSGEAGMRDRAALIAFLAAQPGIASPRFGCVGYCLGGRYALLAAAESPTHIVAAASIHGGRLISDAPDSPHRQVERMRARLYVGAAGIDRGFSPEQRAQLREALTAGGARFELEVYPDVGHGFAVDDLPVYDRAAAERHWDRITRLFKDELPAPI